MLTRPTNPITIRSMLARRETKVIIALLIALTLWVLTGNSPEERTVSQLQDQTSYVPEVKIQSSVAEVFVRELTLSAVTENRRAVEVMAQTAGVVDSINAKEGFPVFEGQVIARLKPDARPAKLEQAKAELNQRQLEYKAAKGLAKSGHRAETALAESYFLMKQAEANLKVAELELGYTHITSPFAGILERMHVHEGNTIESLKTAIASVIDYQPMLVVGYVPEKWRKEITEGSAASVKLVDGHNDALLYGVVSYVSYRAEEATRSFRVEVELENAQGMIAAGISSEIYIPLGNVKAHHVPSSALSLADDGQVQIKHLNSQGIVEAGFIEIAGEDDRGFWVTGLPEHLDIITYGQAYVRAGDIANVSASK